MSHTLKSILRELNRSKTDELKICPASTENRFDGIHNGKNADRSCWVVAGSMCGGKRQEEFAQKYENCQKCDFYQVVRQEEGINMEMIYKNIINISNER